MFPKFTQVGLYSRGWYGGVYTGTYIQDVDWVSYLGGVLTGFHGTLSGHQETFGFLLFLGGKKWEHWLETG